MKKVVHVTMFALILSVAFCLSANAEMAKEGSAEGKAYYTVMVNVLPMEKGRVQLSYEAYAIHSFADKDSPLYNTTGKCLGFLHVIKGEYEDSGSCVLFDQMGTRFSQLIKRKVNSEELRRAL